MLKLWKSAVKDRPALVLFVLVLALSLLFDLSPVVFVVLCAAAGIALTRLGLRGKGALK